MAATGDIVANLHAYPKPWLTGETRENARLIAAAPDLLAALERCIPWMGKLIAEGAHLQSILPNDAVVALDQAEAAIAKARGE